MKAMVLDRVENLAQNRWPLRMAEIPIVLDRQFDDPHPVPDSRAAITFSGSSCTASQALIAWTIPFLPFQRRPGQSPCLPRIKRLAVCLEITIDVID